MGRLCGHGEGPCLASGGWGALEPFLYKFLSEEKQTKQNKNLMRACRENQ